MSTRDQVVGRQAPPHFPPAPLALRARDVADLAVTSGYPCISVLMPTEPSERMRPAEVERLHGLVAEVERHLREHAVVSRDRLLGRLDDEVRRVASHPTDRGLAVYVSLAVTRTFRLPQPVGPRALVEETFATRPLIAALDRMPPHAVLVLHPTCAHLYAAADGALQPVDQVDPFLGRRIRLPRPSDPGAEEARSDLDDGYLRAVDRMLGAYRARHPSPMVLAGSPRLLDRFSALSRNLKRNAGRVHTDEGDSALDLALSCARLVEDYLRSRREDALEQLHLALRVRPEDVATGIEGCWRSLRARAPGMLLVEENFISPSIGDAPGAVQVHDRVDDLMEQVILRGGQLALVRDGDLREHGRVALVVRRDVPGQRRAP